MANAKTLEEKKEFFDFSPIEVKGMIRKFHKELFERMELSSKYFISIMHVYLKEIDNQKESPDEFVIFLDKFLSDLKETYPKNIDSKASKRRSKQC